MRSIKILFALIFGAFLIPFLTRAQTAPGANVGSFTREQCVAYALQNQPAVQQARIDEQIRDREVKAALADWLPQISLAGNLQHYVKMPVTLFPNDAGVLTPRTIGTSNSSNLSFQAEQAIFDNDVFTATRSSRYIRLQSDQNTINTKINTIVKVSQAFYDVLLTQEQLQILNEDITRQEKQFKDAYAQYQQGLVDKTDYQRADISLGNARSQRKRTQEQVKAKLAFLKELMNFPAENNLELAFDQSSTETQMLADTLQPVTYANRIEFQQLQTQKQLQEVTVNYYKWNFLPALSGFANYNYVYQNNDFQQLYQQAYPNSLIGLRLAVPLFQGGKRIQNLRRAQLQQKRLDLDITNTKNQINTEYQTALANYKADLNELETIKRNVTSAEDVYRIIKLQYDEGIKPYFDLILAESELRTTQLNYLNTLYRVLVSKLEVERATGTLNVNEYEK